MQAPPTHLMHCQCCKAGHLMGCFAVGERVAYERKRWHDELRKGIAVGTLGTVVSYQCSRTRYAVLVAFARRGMPALELLFACCELSTRDASAVRICAARV